MLRCNKKSRLGKPRAVEGIVKVGRGGWGSRRGRLFLPAARRRCFGCDGGISTKPLEGALGERRFGGRSGGGFGVPMLFGRYSQALFLSYFWPQEGIHHPLGWGHLRWKGCGSWDGNACCCFGGFFSPAHLMRVGGCCFFLFSGAGRNGQRWQTLPPRCCRLPQTRSKPGLHRHER